MKTKEILIESFKDLPDDMVNIMVPPKIQAMMSGAVHATQNNKGLIALHYEDGTTESAPCEDLELNNIKSFFEVVSIIQDRNRNNKKEPIK